ncbi:hypothetical protein ACFFWB_26995 [Flavobacterium procerum]|uniref:hypothetical protein n=1 Tax=Flavobacterium procerum TaxID=1455569 RepID=UPI0035E754D2
MSPIISIKKIFKIIKKYHTPKKKSQATVKDMGGEKNLKFGGKNKVKTLPPFFLEKHLHHPDERAQNYSQEENWNIKNIILEFLILIKNCTPAFPVARGVSLVNTKKKIKKTKGKNVHEGGTLG